MRGSRSVRIGRSHAPRPAWPRPLPSPLAEFLGEAKSKIEELSTLLAEREEEFYSFKNDVRRLVTHPLGLGFG